MRKDWPDTSPMHVGGNLLIQVTLIPLTIIHPHRVGLLCSNNRTCVFVLDVPGCRGAGEGNVYRVVS